MKARQLLVWMGLLGTSVNAWAGETIFHAAPKAWASGAIGTDWTRFLGPSHNASSPETQLLKQWDASEPRRVWEFTKGVGHACPAISGSSVVVFHRLAGDEVVDCLDLETGKTRWSFQYGAPYHDRYGGGNGPRTSPLVEGNRVFVFGISGWMHCLDLAAGKVLWKHDFGAEFAMAENFFGHGSTPLVIGERLIVNLGGKDNLCVAAFDCATGKLQWKASHPWGASYASPVPAKIHGRQCVLLFAGGESRPPTGGLLCLDAATGEVLSSTEHRSSIAESVNASSPVVFGEKVFVTESYGVGGRMVEYGPDFKARTLWQAPKFGACFMTPLLKDGYLYGFDGQQPRLTELVCYEAASGQEMWRDDLGGKFQRGSLLGADGDVLCLGENGRLAWLELSPKGAKILSSKDLFEAPESWTLPALSHGLLFVSQNQADRAGKPPRLICFDLRRR